jgi:hypothetical protein
LSPRVAQVISSLIFSSLLLSHAHASMVEPTYFLLTERSGSALLHDSFVLPLVDSQQISHARDIIARGPDSAGEPIIFASISAGSDHLNRNLIVSGQPEWNWHVTSASGFDDVGIELLDGSPTYVSQHLDTWLRETGGHIGFWNYTVSKELAGYPDRVPPIPVPLPPAVPATLIALGVVLPTIYLARRRRAQ